MLIDRTNFLLTMKARRGRYIPPRWQRFRLLPAPASAARRQADIRLIVPEHICPSLFLVKDNYVYLQTFSLGALLPYSWSLYRPLMGREWAVQFLVPVEAPVVQAAVPVPVPAAAAAAAGVPALLSGPALPVAV